MDIDPMTYQGQLAYDEIENDFRSYCLDFWGLVVERDKVCVTVAATVSSVFVPHIVTIQISIYPLCEILDVIPSSEWWWWW